jgi:hypothetical protein
MRGLYAFLLLVSQLVGQGVPAPRRAQRIAAGARARLILNLNKRPEDGDRILVDISTDKIRTVLITPDGRRVDEANSGSAGLRWNASGAFTPPLGSTDGGRSIDIDFEESGRAGRYVFEFDATSTTTPSDVKGRFIPHNPVISLLPGFRKVGPVTLNGPRRSVPLDLTLTRPEKDGVFDIVITDPTANVSITMPGGRVIVAPEGKEEGVAWTTVQKPRDLDRSSESFFLISGFLLSRDGTHHVFRFDTAAEGRYQIRAQTSEKARVQLTAAFIPIGRASEELAKSLEEVYKIMEKPPSAPPGQLRVEMNSLPDHWFVGDPLKILVHVVGDPVREPLKFHVQLEYRARLGVTDGTVHWDHPVVEDTDVVLARTPEGAYTGAVTLTRSGLLRVGVEAIGTTEKGKAFSGQYTSSVAIVVIRRPEGSR